MKVVMMTASVSRRAGGLFHSVRRLAQETARVPAVEVNVISSEDEHTAEDVRVWDGVQVRLTRVMGPRAFGYAPGIRGALDQVNGDILHCHGLWMFPSVACGRWARRRGRPYIISAHGMLDGWALRNSAWKKRIARRLYEDANLGGAACLGALCDPEARAMRALGLKNPICVIPNGEDVPAFPSPRPAPWAGAIPDSAKVLFYLGRLHPKKGLPNLLRGWASVEEGIRDEWRLVIAGWDQRGHEKELKTLARELHVEDTVAFAGALFGEQKEAGLSSASAFVLPSFSEGLPMTVLEAWAYRLPVIMTPECNLPEGFQAGAAIPVTVDVVGIAESLRELFRMTDAERCAMGERGRRLVEERFSWPKIARDMVKVYEWVLGGGSKPNSVID